MFAFTTPALTKIGWSSAWLLRIKTKSVRKTQGRRFAQILRPFCWQEQSRCDVSEKISGQLHAVPNERNSGIRKNGALRNSYVKSIERKELMKELIVGLACGARRDIALDVSRKLSGPRRSVPTHLRLRGKSRKIARCLWI